MSDVYVEKRGHQMPTHTAWMCVRVHTVLACTPDYQMCGNRCSYDLVLT